MNKKIFQIFFFIIVLISFAVIIKNYVDARISKLEDYNHIIKNIPEREISRLSPIVINLSQDIDLKKNTLNQPLTGDFIRFRPNIKGYTYFTDRKTLEFQPNEPLPPDQKYTARINFSKIFTKIKIRPFIFKFSTPKVSFKININDVCYFDSSQLINPKLSGNVVFNDFIETDKFVKLIKAFQDNKPLQVVYSPTSNSKTQKFSILNIVRKKNTSSVKVIWSGKEMGINIKDSLTHNIVSKDSFQIISTKVGHFPKSSIEIVFSDEIKQKQFSDSLIFITGINNHHTKISNNKITIDFINPVYKDYILRISKNLQNSTGVKLNADFEYHFRLIPPEPFAKIQNNEEINSSGNFNGQLNCKAFNTSLLNLEVFHIPDKNVLQFLQVNDLDENNELQRVGKLIYSQLFDLTENIDFDSNQYLNYTLYLLGADFNDAGIYHFKLSYRGFSSFFNNSVFSDTLKNLAKYDFKNFIFSDINVVAKRSSTDSLYVFVNNKTDGKPIKNARIEIYDYQQQTKATLLTSANGIAKGVIANNNLFIKVINNNQATYLKLSDIGKLKYQNSDLSGILAKKGLLCNVINLKSSYLKGDSLSTAIILRNQNQQLYRDEIIEIKLKSPDNLFLNTKITQSSQSNIFKFHTKIPKNALSGIWELMVSIEDISFSFPFRVITNDVLNAPIDAKLLNNKIILKEKQTTKSHLANRIFTYQLKPYKSKNYQNSTYDVLSDTRPYKLLNETNATKARFNKNGIFEIKPSEFSLKKKDFHLFIEVPLDDNIVLRWDSLFISPNSSQDFKIEEYSNNTTFTSNKNDSNKNIDIFENTALKISLNAKKLYPGDSCLIKYTTPQLGYTLLTIENSQQILESIWINSVLGVNTHSLSVSEKWLPGVYISILHFTNNGTIATNKYLAIEWPLTQLNDLSVFMPHDWKPGEKTTIQINNQSEKNIQYFFLVEQRETNDYPIFNKNQKQRLTLETWFSNYVPHAYKQKNDEHQTIKENLLNEDSHLQKNTFSKLYGPYTINSNSKINQNILAPLQLGNFKVNIIGIQKESNKLIQVTKEASIQQPIFIEANLPQYVQPENKLFVQLHIHNNTNLTDTFQIRIASAKNIEFNYDINKKVIAAPYKSASYSLNAQIKSNSGTAQFVIEAISKTKKTTQQYEVPIYQSNYTNQHIFNQELTETKEWQYTINPLGIMGTNEAIIQISPAYLPNLPYFMFNFNQQSFPTLSNLINDVFYLPKLLALTSNTENITICRKKIKNILSELFQYQCLNGGFKNNINDTDADLALSCFVGWFILESKNQNIQINEGIYNRWLRYIKREWQPYANINSTSKPPFFLVHTLCQLQIIDQKAITKYTKLNNLNLNEHLYLTHSLINLNKKRQAAQFLKIDSIISILPTLNLTELSLLVSILSDIKLSQAQKNTLEVFNNAIKKYDYSPYEASLALYSILSFFNKQDAPTFDINYAINHGQEHEINNKSIINNITLPIEFTLPKHIDIKKTGADTLMVNLFSKGNPQEINKNIKHKNIEVKSTYVDIYNSPLKQNTVEQNQFIKQLITCKNITNKVIKNISTEIPKPTGFEWIQIFHGSIKQGHESFKTNVLNEIYTLQPYETKNITIVYKAKYKGEFIIYPVKTILNETLFNNNYTPTSHIIVR